MFDLNSLHQTSFNWQTALSMAMASELAYRPASAIESVARGDWRFDECRFIERNHIACFVVRTDSAILVSFRGTDSLAYWLSGLDVDSSLSTNYGSVHRGFVEAFRSIAPEVVDTIQQFKPRRKLILLTGHSLGAAVAAIAACEVAKAITVNAIYTFGQPRVGDVQTVDFVARKYPSSFHRFVFADDIVTRLPPDYLHVGQLYHFDTNGLLLSSPSEAAVYDNEQFKRLKATAKSIHLTAKATIGSEVDSREAAAEVADRSLEGLVFGVRDHRLSQYLFAVRNQIPRAKEFISEAVIVPQMEKSKDNRLAKSIDNRLEEFKDKWGPESDALTMYPVQVRARDRAWRPPAGTVLISHVGPFFSLQATKDEIERMQHDASVASLELSREIDSSSTREHVESIGFVKANLVHTGPFAENGDDCIVAIIDTGIDILHETFLDSDLASGSAKTRIDAIWVQWDNSGKTPFQVDSAFKQNFGTLYVANDINAYINNDLMNKNSTTPSVLRDPGNWGGSGGHGTHVASIAAGRPVGTFSGGMAPHARIVVVVPDMKTQPQNPPSLGYSVSHQAALEFLLAYKRHRNMPMAINMSLGMNAGAHDGTTDLEKLFDSISNQGSEEGFIIVKSAGNERGFRGHVREQVAPGVRTDITWQSSNTPRLQDYFEFWYWSGDDLEFRLTDPANHSSPWVKLSNPRESWTSQGNDIYLTLRPYHPGNNDHLLTVKIISVSGAIQSGTWKLSIVGKSIGISPNKDTGIIDGWIERNDDRPVNFDPVSIDDITLSIPGTASTVVSVAASDLNDPMQLIAESSFGPTRKNGPKPDINAPGDAILAACSNSKDHQELVAMTGTSMAAPHVTGVMALVLSARHKKCAADPSKIQFNAIELAGMVIRSAKNYNQLHNKGTGYGGLDALAFFREADLR